MFDAKIDASADLAESLALREWVWCARKHFEKIQKQNPELKYELKFVGAPYAAYRKVGKSDCGCSTCKVFDPLGILRLVPSRPCVAAAYEAHLERLMHPVRDSYQTVDT